MAEAEDDPDAQAALLPGWQQRYLPLARGPLAGQARHVALAGGTALLRRSTGCALHKRFAVPPGLMAVAVLAPGCAEVRCGGVAARAGDALLLPGGVEIDLVCSAGFDAWVATFAHALVVDAGLASGAGPGAAVVAASPAAQRLALLLEAIERRAASRGGSGGLGAPPVAASEHGIGAAAGTRALAARDIEAAALDVIAAAHPARPPARLLLSQLVEAFDAATELPEGPRVATLARALGLPLRTLQHAFRAQTGVTPHHYLECLRLARTRTELQRGAASTTVAAAAMLHGFWHLGRYAQAYRGLYGELPSQTLARSG